MNFLFATLITLTNLWGSVSVETLGARVVSYIPAGGEEVFWNETPPQLTDADWAHGGMPNCWPWFGRRASDEMIHGTSWRRSFTVESRRESPDASELKLSLTDADARLEFTLTLAKELQVELRTINNSAGDYRFSMGFHPYFRVSERDAVTAKVGDGEVFDYRDSPDNSIKLNGELAVKAWIFDPGLQRTIRLGFEHATLANRWNPGPALECPGTIRGEGWRHFVALEPIVRGAEKVVVLPPKSRQELKLTIETVAAH